MPDVDLEGVQQFGERSGQDRAIEKAFSDLFPARCLRDQHHQDNNHADRAGRSDQRCAAPLMFFKLFAAGQLQCFGASHAT